jgi:hypothetical protein
VVLLSKEEAISLILAYSRDNRVSSITKLNKLLARLNFFMIPADIDFRLNKYGSYNPDVQFETNQNYEVYSYDWRGDSHEGLRILPSGMELADQVVQHKLKKILTDADIQELKAKIYHLSQMAAGEISEEEHKSLLVDEDDRTQLIHRINTVSVEFLDLYEDSKKLPESSTSSLRLSAFIEYCYSLTKFLKEKRFKNIEMQGYDFDAYMFDYYFLYLLEKDAIPFIKSQLSQIELDSITINRYYQYFINFARSRYSFSLDNPELSSLVS